MSLSSESLAKKEKTQFRKERGLAVDQLEKTAKNYSMTDKNNLVLSKNLLKLCIVLNFRQRAS